MNPLRYRTLIGLALAALLLGGCATSGPTASWNNSSSLGKPRSAISGWGGYDRTPPPADEAQTSDSEGEMTAGICYVKAPHIPSPPESVQVLKRAEHPIPGTTSVIPAEYATAQNYPKGQEGFAWLPAVCQESVDRHLIMKVQEALIAKGYDIGAVDGVEGPATRAGLEYFKRDHGLYGDGYTHEVLQALGIDPKTGGLAFASI